MLLEAARAAFARIWTAPVVTLMQRVLALLLFTAATAFKTQCAASKELILPRPKIMERPPSNTDATPFGELKAALPQQKPVVEQLQEKA